MDHIIKFLYSFFSVAVTAFSAASFTDMGIKNFYASLALPPLMPENEIFPLVWSVLYALMVISFYMVLRGKNTSFIRQGVLLFLSQLLLQILWTYLFFAKGLFLQAQIIIIILDLTVFQMLLNFMRISKLSSYIQYPYFAWLLFATYLNGGIIYLNGYALNF